MDKEPNIPLLTLADYEARARQTMPTALFDRMFGARGMRGRETHTNNLEAFDAIKLRPRVMMDVSRRDLATEVLGQKISFPVMICPAGIHQRAHSQGELASARAAGAAGTVMLLSTAASYSIEEVKAVAAGPLWFQLYIFQDRKISEILTRRAQRAGYSAIVVTVDNLGAVSRERKHRYAYQLEAERRLRNFVEIDRPDLPTIDDLNEHYDPTFDWKDLDWLRSITNLPILLKGIQTGEDARLCVEHGVDGLIISNHGGRSLQCARGTAEILPEVVDAVGDQVEVYLDGGVRRGTDILKALALGSRAVLIGSPLFWGLSVDGEAGLRHVLEILRNELKVAMGLSGVTGVRNVDRSLVSTPWDQQSSGNVVLLLDKLAQLLEKGYITREEFEGQKAKLLR